MYSSDPFLLNSQATLLAGDRIFVGNQPDDVAIGAIVSLARNACLLGLGYGGALRPMLAAAPDCKITGVDINDDLLRAARSIFRVNFPDIDFNTVLGDASTCLPRIDEKFDLIIVDVYVSDSYPEFMFTRRFWETVRASLSADGAAILNAWGLPEHLEPLRPPSPQHQLAGVLTEFWPGSKYLSCRRNMTVVLGGIPAAPRREAVICDGALTPLDRAVLRFQRVRLDHAAVIPSMLESASQPCPASPAALDDEMKRRWPVLMQHVRDCAKSIGADAESVGSRDFYRPEVAIPVTLELARRNSPAASLVPTVAASFSFAGDRSVDWFGEWIAKDAIELYEACPEWLITFGMPQALSMAANPLTPSCDWHDDIAERALLVADAASGEV